MSADAPCIVCGGDSHYKCWDNGRSAILYKPTLRRWWNRKYERTRMRIRRPLHDAKNPYRMVTRPLVRWRSRQIHARGHDGWYAFRANPTRYHHCDECWWRARDEVDTAAHLLRGLRAVKRGDSMKRLIVFTLFAGVMLSASPAHALPPTSSPAVSCTTVTIDPEPTWGVVFDGTISGQTVHLVAAPLAGTHSSTADISAFTTAPGPIAYELAPTWTIPENPYGVTSGEGPTVTGTLTCHEAPSTSSSTTSISRVASSTTTVPQTSTTACSEPRGCCLADCGGPPTTVGTLPRTGSSTESLAIVGLLALLLGALGLAHSRRKIR